MTRKKDEKAVLLATVIKELEPGDKFPVWVVMLEMKKLAKDLKMILIHIYDQDRLEYQASITTSIEKSDPKWQKYDRGKSEYSVITFGGREKKLGEKLKDFIERSFNEGKLQDFWPF